MDAAVNKLKTAVIGVGNMGARYARMLQAGQIEGMELAALTRMREPYLSQMAPSIQAGIPVFDSADALFDSIATGQLALDAAIIATPHYDHEGQAVRAFRHGLHVLCEKPAGVYSAQSRRMVDAADASGRKFGVVFQQRLLPLHKRLKEIVDSGIYGRLKRLSWTVTDWYRPDKYFAASSWHAAWATDGGGVVLNQCPHNLDLLCWLFGTPARVQAFCHEGRFHNIEVEDDVTAYLEWENGATGTFVSSTGDLPGLNRLEITMDEATLICEHGQLQIYELAPVLGMKEIEYRRSSDAFFQKISGKLHTETLPEAPDCYRSMLQGFADSCVHGTPLPASGLDGHTGVVLANAIYLSSWQKKMVEIPAFGSAEERAMEDTYEELLRQKIEKQQKI